MSIKHQTIHLTARQRVEDIARYMTVPGEITDAIKHLDAVEAMQPEPVTTTDLADAYAARDTKRINALAVALATEQQRRAAWTEARARAGKAVMSAVTRNGDAIIAELADHAAPLNEQITAAAKVETHDVAVLLRAGRKEDADLVARLDLLAGDLTTLYSLRDHITAGADYGVGGIGCGVWRDPRPVTQAQAGRTTLPGTPAGRYVQGIRAGGQLWFPTPAEALAAAQRIYRERESQRQAEETENWRRATGARPRRDRRVSVG